MQLLRKYHSLLDAQQDAMNLRSRGVATHISGKESYRAAPIFSGVFYVSLWVVLDHQYDDALALLDDPDHTVNDPLPAEDIDVLEADFNGEASRHVFSFIMIGAIVMLGLFLLLVEMG